jgi:hypothetical protein
MRFPHRFPQTALAAVVLAVAPAAHAGLHKCKGPGGSIIYSDEPCAKVGGREEKTFTKSELRGNAMRMRPRPPQGDGSAPEFGGGSSFKGAAPERASAPRPQPTK